MHFGFGRIETYRRGEIEIGFFAYIPFFITPWNAIAFNEYAPGFLYGRKILAIRPAIIGKTFVCPFFKLAIGKQLELEHRHGEPTLGVRPTKGKAITWAAIKKQLKLA